jgi:hypothetical protein
MNQSKNHALALAEVKRKYPDLQGAELAEAVDELLHDWAAEDAHYRAAYGEPNDTPSLEEGRDNCNDWGTGEGQFHGRI